METQELRKGDHLLIERDRERAEVSSQFAELQTFFDEVSHQMYTECKHLEGLQEIVNACVKQSMELEAIHHKLEESHLMLTQMRDTRAWRENQDSESPETRATTYPPLTLLDVLKHFKEKLQSLTPQMLLTRLGVADTQAPTQGVDKLLNASMR